MMWLLLLIVSYVFWYQALQESQSRLRTQAPVRLIYALLGLSNLIYAYLPNLYPNLFNQVLLIRATYLMASITLSAQSEKNWTIDTLLNNRLLENLALILALWYIYLNAGVYNLLIGILIVDGLVESLLALHRILAHFNFGLVLFCYYLLHITVWIILIIVHTAVWAVLFPVGLVLETDHGLIHNTRYFILWIAVSVFMIFVRLARLWSIASKLPFYIIWLLES